MGIINAYLTRETVRYFCVVLAMVIGIYLIVDFLEKIDDFLEAGVPLSRFLCYLICKSPFVFTQMAPVGILLSVLIVFGLMSRHNEIVALKGSGVSVYSLLKPILSVGGLLSLFMLLVSEVLVPIAMTEANRIWLNEVRKETAVTSKKKNIWIKGNRRIANVRFYNHRTQTLFGVALNNFDDQFRLSKRIDALRGKLRGGRWVLEDVMVQELQPGKGTYSVALHEQWPASLDFLPEDLNRVVKKSEAMGFLELRDYIGRIEAEGYDASLYRVDLHSKAAFPVVCMIMAVVGAGIAVRNSPMEGLPVSISYGIGTVFLYHVFHSFCLSLGYGGILPPILSAWAANLVFVCLGGFLLLSAD